MSSDPDQIRREIERTRGDLSGNVNALGDKVNPGSIARRQAGRVRGAATSVKETVMGRDSDPTDSGVLGSVGDTVTEAPGALTRKAQGSPVAAGLIAFGAGLLLASLLPASQAEQQAAENIKQKAQPLVDDLTDAGKEIAGNLQEPAQQALEEVKATASDAADTVKDEATTGAQDVKSQAQDSADAVRHTAQ